ncbi:DNA ligase D [Aestuariivirga litoralis]|uniref:DNA ligase D n=1 Tax=Aestuariivirga litoralis TaxID=2650924 RepID=UPI0018C59271|nr:DNA ligase D [Aestuariivirga litoralis]MBG1233397.1 DNA ligase D [Aestuariivirga litoralis]
MRGGMLAEYGRKRNFSATSEPKPAHKKQKGRSFVVQRHWATREHFDLRLEMNGVMVSWAVTRGPSANPADKRLAVKVEDHPVSYSDFEGTIPKGQYGGGTVMVWDRGDYTPLVDDLDEALRGGKLKIEFHGERMKGGYALVRMHTRDKSHDNWLLIKERDEYAVGSSNLPGEHLTSVKTGRNRDEIAGGTQVWKTTPTKGASKERAAFVKPMLCKLVDAPPDGAAWLHEDKYDGYRIQIVKNGDTIRLYSREGLDWTEKFPSITKSAAKLKAVSAIIDGEAVVFNKSKVSDFGQFVAALKESPAQIEYMAFDALFYDGADLRREKLSARKLVLEKLLPAKDKYLHLSPFTLGDGAKRFAKSLKDETEGIVSKRLDSKYISGRGDSWVKAKHGTREDVVVVGYTPSTKGRAFGALVSAVENKKALDYSGRIGTGFSVVEQKRLLEILKGLERKGPPPSLRNAQLAPRGTKWVQPELRVEVAMAGWTPDHQLRHPRYLALRAMPETKAPVMKAEPPKKPKAVSKSSTPLVITHGDRVVFPDAKITKQQIADYYDEVAELVLPHLAGRPVSFVRAPESIAKETFFQRHALNGMRAGIERVPDPEGKHDDFLAIADKSGLRSCAQFGIVEFHGWGSHLPHLDKPDRVVFDLDPDENVDFAEVKRAALQLRDMLKEIGLASWPLLSGGKGVHIIAPLDGTQDWDMIGTFTKGIARGLAEQDPKHFIATASKAQRSGKIYVDWLRNKMTATAIVPWSLRARATASVAVPITWEELPNFKSAARYTIKDHPSTNAWRGFFTKKQAIPAGAIAFLKSRWP